MNKTIYCIGRNYVKHIQELSNEVPTSPLVFLKAPASLRGLKGGPLAYPQETFHHEIELVLQIGRDFKLGENCGHDDISAIGLGIDLTRREIQTELKKQGLPWTTAKSFAGSALLGSLRPYEETQNITFDLFVNGQLKQHGESQNMIYPFLDICNYLNSFSPLQKGDLIFTGTPEGVGEIKKNDVFEFVLNGLIREQGVL